MCYNGAHENNRTRQPNCKTAPTPRRAARPHCQLPALGAGGAGRLSDRHPHLPGVDRLPADRRRRPAHRPCHLGRAAPLRGRAAAAGLCQQLGAYRQRHSQRRGRRPLHRRNRQVHHPQQRLLLSAGRAAGLCLFPAQRAPLSVPAADTASRRPRRAFPRAGGTAGHGGWQPGRRGPGAPGSAAGHCVRRARPLCGAAWCDAARLRPPCG